MNLKVIADSVKMIRMKYKNEIVITLPEKNNFSLLHVSIKGPGNSAFEGGIYHFQYKLHNFPAMGPEVSVFTPNGGFTVNVPLCIVGSTYAHGEEYQQGYNLDSIIVSVQSMMVEDQNRGYGYGFIMNQNPVLIKELAQQSRSWTCTSCNCDHSKLVEQFYGAQVQVDPLKDCPETSSIYFDLQ